jgi:hypothetical protein
MRKKYFISRIDGLHVDDCREVSRSTFYKWRKELPEWYYFWHEGRSKDGRNRVLVYSI